MFRIPTIIRTIGHFPLRVVHLSEPARFWPAGIKRKRKTAHVSLEASQARNPLNNRIKVRIHGAILRAILRAIPELHRVSTPKFVARNIAAVESRPTSATLRATNFFVYPPSAAFRAIV